MATEKLLAMYCFSIRLKVHCKNVDYKILAIYVIAIDNITKTQSIGLVTNDLRLFGNTSESDIWPGML